MWIGAREIITSICFLFHPHPKIIKFSFYLRAYDGANDGAGADDGGKYEDEGAETGANGWA